MSLITMSCVPSYLARITFEHLELITKYMSGHRRADPRIAETNRYMKPICGLCNRRHRQQGNFCQFYATYIEPSALPLT